MISPFYDDRKTSLHPSQPSGYCNVTSTITWRRTLILILFYIFRQGRVLWRLFLWKKTIAYDVTTLFYYTAFMRFCRMEKVTVVPTTLHHTDQCNFTRKITIYGTQNVLYYIKTNEMPGELSRENMISSHVKIKVSSHVKRSPLLWLHNRSRLLQWFGI